MFFFVDSIGFAVERLGLSVLCFWLRIQGLGVGAYKVECKGFAAYGVG